MKLFIIPFLIFIILTNNLFSQKAETIFLSPADSSQNYYHALIPDSASKGLLLIIGGFCATPEDVLQETKLPQMAVKAGYTVVIPCLYSCDSMDVNRIAQKRLEILIPALLKKYPVPGSKFIIGGQSMGGHQAFYYTEMAFKYNKLPKPAAVFGVDPPLNFKRLWNGFERSVRINFSEVAVAEAKEQMRRFKIIYGGSPQQKPKVYEAMSSYFADAKDGGNARYLKNVPVRLYADPDIDWMINERRGTVEFFNLADVTGCISQLKMLGNKNAEFINCLGKGFKPNGERHIHYFSMLDADEFVKWADKIFVMK